MTYKTRALQLLASHDPEAVNRIAGRLRDTGTGVRQEGGVLTDFLVRNEAAWGDAVGQVRLEGIILRSLRPPLLVQNGSYELPGQVDDGLQPLMTHLADERTRKRAALAFLRTGSLAVLNVPGLAHLATGWVVRRDGPDTATVVTNRHVARHFAGPDGLGRHPLRLAPQGGRWNVQLDLKNEHARTDTWPLRVEEVLYMAADTAPDIALLRVRGTPVEDLHLETGDMLGFAEPAKGAYVGIVGYPADDPAADRAAVDAYFDGIFNRKRFGWARVLSRLSDAVFSHDASTLGGNSGSMMFDLDTGAVVGLHYGWVPDSANARIGGHNVAVTGAEVEKVLQGLRPSSVPGTALPEAVRWSDPGAFRGRDGYRPDFLGPPVEPPAPLGHPLAEATNDDDGTTTTELRYRHFSVWMRAGRRLPLMTAVNIDGASAKRLGRGDWWFLDHRLPGTAQAGPDGYAGNALDRGHMVRREDPVWGNLDEAAEANRDTFAYTNAAPQHEALNQRHWLRLEDYILANARTLALRVSVFTGPVLRDDDPPYHAGPDGAEAFRIPLSFWKIACVVDVQTGRLSASGYLLAQGDMVRRMLEEFTYGGFMTYQVPLRRIAEVAGLGLDHLLPFDPLEDGRPLPESGLRPIHGADDIVL